MDPISANERVQLLDVLRGFAIFGMFTVNMTGDLPWGDMFREQTLEVADRTVMILVDLFANGKFITTFSFLFGVGFCIQLERAQTRGSRFTLNYLRRLVGLFLIAAAAMVAGLGTHILIDYAMYGVLLPFFYKRSMRVLLASVIACFAIGGFSGTMDYIEELRESKAALAQETIDFEDSVDQDETDNAERERIYRQGSFTEIASYRFARLLRYVANWKQRLWDMDLLGLMLLGCYVFRLGVFHNSDTRRRVARAALPWLLGIGATGTVITVWLEHFATTDPESITILVVQDLAFWPIGAPVLGLGYAAGIALLIERDWWKRVLSPLAAVGRVALTNYLFHAFVIAAFTYSWGLGLYGQMGPFWGLMTVLAIYPLMVAASGWWIRRFQFGPVEYLWRAFTYGHLPPMRLEAAQ